MNVTLRNPVGRTVGMMPIPSTFETEDALATLCNKQRAKIAELSLQYKALLEKYQAALKLIAAHAGEEFLPPTGAMFEVSK
jgi:hypothetical protein